MGTAVGGTVGAPVVGRTVGAQVAGVGTELGAVVGGLVFATIFICMVLAAASRLLDSVAVATMSNSVTPGFDVITYSEAFSVA